MNRRRGERPSARRLAPPRTTCLGTLKGVAQLNDMNSWTDRTGQARLRSFLSEDGRFLLEQNPQKRSKWSVLARKGHQIAWEFEGPGGAYTGRVLVDGEVCTPAEGTRKYFNK